MRFGVLTTGRQDWGILRSTCAAIRAADGLELVLFVGGMHSSRRFGLTRDLIREDGFDLDVEMSWLEDDQRAVWAEAGAALTAVGDALASRSVDALVLVGDRFETAAAALAATLAKLPIVHLHGGEETEGAFDNAFRHAITKLSHLHLVSHPDYARRVIAMGESPATVHVVGAPGLDNLRRSDLASRPELEELLGALPAPLVVVTLHPTTLGGDPAREAEALVAAMSAVPATYVITLPNADPGNADTRRVLVTAARQHGWRTVEALGERRYWGLIKLADALAGNSSSALLEAPALALPSLNVGDRQKGRLRGANIMDVPAEAEAIRAGLDRVLDPSFRAAIKDAPSPFGDGRSAERIVTILRSWRPQRPPVKPRFERSA
jgi:UDP-N-acetylglucosamine 2-epimerase (non-hydrolysing)